MIKEYDCFIKRNRVSVLNWIQKFQTTNHNIKKKIKVIEYVIDETLIKCGSELI